MDNSDKHASLMDRIYASQRHIYDVTRKYYLLGRDDALRQLAPLSGGRLLEIGCGTGRNLVLAAKIYPDVQLFGIDISKEMLKSARANMIKEKIADRVHLQRGDATAFDGQAMFGAAGFDRVLISYAVSMMPEWELAILHAARCLKPGGVLHVVDFGQQADLPAWFRAALRRWLAQFHVQPRAGLAAVLLDVSKQVDADVEMRRSYRDYTWHGVLRRKGGL